MKLIHERYVFLLCLFFGLTFELFPGIIFSDGFEVEAAGAIA